MQSNSDSSRNITLGNIGGDFNASGQALNLGDISGQVTNTINQLPDATDSTQPNLKDLLTPTPNQHSNRPQPQPRRQNRSPQPSQHPRPSRPSPQQ
ncbi:MAG: hypothetical protein HC857_13920, partial [Synechococcales cyanobacterium RU_4_20]|nr:hypothetical protein [Synechococcales cyanobacterium RU_4_20]